MAGYIDAAIAVLSEDGGALHSNEITRRATDRGHLKHKSATPGASMAAAIYMDIKKLGAKSRFVRAGPSTFSLRPDPEPPESEGESPVPEPTEDDRHGIPQNTENDPMYAQKMGAAGEHRVMSELLLRGYGAERVTIDDGVDIWAEKDGCQFYIQVKTVTGKNNKYISTIRKKSFTKKRNLQMYSILD